MSKTTEERLRQDLGICQSFHKVAVSQRDGAWGEIERLMALVAVQDRMLGEKPCQHGGCIQYANLQKELEEQASTISRQASELRRLHSMVEGRDERIEQLEAALGSFDAVSP
jgi:hypothetical protein